MVNPDDFILHSDFWYPTNYLSGSLTLTNVDIPAVFTLSDKFKEGDFYSVYIDYPSNSSIAEQYMSDAVSYRTKGNLLQAHKLAQSVGSKFTGTFHWRIYPRNRTLNFQSINNLETTDKTLVGSFPFTGINTVNIPSGLTGKYFVRGMWRDHNGKWIILNGGSSDSTMVQSHYKYDTNTVYMFARDFKNTVPANAKIEYKLQLVPLTLPNKFIFNSNKYSFAIPQVIEATLTDTGTIGPNATKYIYGDWVTVGQPDMPFNPIYRWMNNSEWDTKSNWDEYTFGPSIYASPYVEVSGNKMRPYLKVTSYNSSTQNYGTQKVKYYIYTYQNNNAG